MSNPLVAFIAVFIMINATILFALGTMWAALYYGGIIGFSVWTAFMCSVFIAASAYGEPR